MPSGDRCRSLRAGDARLGNASRLAPAICIDATAASPRQRARIDLRVISFTVVLFALALTPLLGWDYDGHRIINKLALASLPADFPKFVREPAAAERIAFLSGEPDRWRNAPDLPLRHVNNPDHYFDFEQLGWAGLDPASASPLRYEFALQFAAGRAAHPGNFRPIDPGRNADRTREWPGFLPWEITEDFERLRSVFSCLRAFQEAGGTASEIANEQANAIDLMGVMGHYVGDGAQPLHDTVQHNGWVVGDNPHGFTTDPKFHAWIDGGFIARARITFDRLASQARPARSLRTDFNPGERDAMFTEVMRYLEAQNRRVEPLYQLEKSGMLRADDSPGSEKGREFIDEQLLRGGEMLGSLWLTAWRTAPPDRFLLQQLARRTITGRTTGGP
jgi:hypothetical protein